MEIHESITIAQKPQTIWDLWLHVEKDIQWRDGFTKAEWTSPPPYGVGSTGTHYHTTFGTIPWKITKYEDGRFFEFVHVGGRIKGSIASFLVEPEGDGSRVTLNTTIAIPFIVMVFMRGKIRKGLQSDLHKLKKLMEDPSHENS